MAKIGAIYPGFKAFYDQGYDNGEVFFEIDHDHGKTLDQMVSMALQYEDQGIYYLSLSKPKLSTNSYSRNASTGNMERLWRRDNVRTNKRIWFPVSDFLKSSDWRLYKL